MNTGTLDEIQIRSNNMLEIIKDQDALQVKISSSNGIPFNHILDKLK